MKNFLIVGTQRTGSSVLTESIGFHTLVACGWEWTLHVPRSQKLKVAERALAGDFSVLSQPDRAHMAEVWNIKKTWLGFRRLFCASDKWLIHPRFSPALWSDRLEDHLHWLAERPDIYIIHIVRRDGLDWLKSKFLARASGLYVGKPYQEGLRVTIPLREAVFRLRAKEWVDYRLASLSSQCPYVRIDYEDFLADQDAVVTETLRFLQCDPNVMPVERRRQKQSRSSVADYVANYDELVTELERHELLWVRFDQY